ncbi:MAG: flagellar hook-length control protein FliK [Candidatus Baltobacteraceae bacterium]
MSALDPLAHLASQNVADALATIAEVTLNLGVSTDALQGQIRTGDLIAAIVLPPQNGTDALSLFGITIAAQLPPGVHPGESLLLQVTGFSGQQILVRNLGAIDPLRPPQTIYVELPEANVTPQSAMISVRQPSVPAATTNAAPAPTVAPPREVFVAASVRPIEGEAALRLAVTRSAAGDLSGRLPNARAIRSLPQPATTTPLPVRPAQLTPQAALLTRLRVPISAATLVAVRMADEAAQHVTSSYARLDDALAKLGGADSRVGSLRALLAFTGKIDLRNGRALPEQIAAFLSHVVGSAESKLAQIVRALVPTGAEISLPAETPRTLLSETPQTVPPGSAAPVAPPSPDSLARAAERNVALDHDLKTAILSLLRNPPRDFPAQATQALGNALGATTALQLNVLSAQNADPGAIAIPLPAYFYEGGKPTQLRISRDPGKSGKRMDADNFSVSFVLDTKTLGTVAIDLQTAGRAVSVSVKTEGASAANRFRDSLSHLRDRLEGLRYRVAAMGAEVAPRSAPAVPSAESAVEPTATSASNVDLRA